MNYKSDKLIGHVLASLTILVWGTTFISSKILLRDFTPLQVMIMRFLIAYITLLLMNHEIKKTTWKEELTFFTLAMMGTTLYFIFENRALTLTFASNVSIILSAAPILTAILAHYFTKDEKITKTLIQGSLLAFVGVALVVFNGTIILKLNPLGDLLSLAAALCWAVYSVILKKQVSRYESVYLTRRVLFYAILTTLPLLFIEHKQFQLQEVFQYSNLFHVLFLGALGSGLCYVAWNLATKKLGIITTNNYIYLSPFVTMTAAGFLLKEKVTVMGIIGAVLIILGVVVAGKSKK